MMATYLIAVAFAQEPVLDLFPGDRTRVPLHVADEYTLAEWQREDDRFRKLHWALWRSMQRNDQAEREGIQTTRRLYATLRSVGTPNVPSDPVEPTLPYWRRSWKMETEPRKDR